MKKYSKFEVVIGGFVNVWLDNYENGQQGNFCNDWSIDEKVITVENLNKSSLKQIKNNILELLNENVYESVSMRKFNKLHDVCDNRVLWSQLTNEDNSWLPSKSDMILFKRGTKDLYVQDINITVTINGEDVLEDDLVEILNTK